ncbi:uncharacterized protein LOC133847748 isoform X6 [Drosophila sulfurigaster albostrigata]|uniref:Uncharacterized protein LOC117574014 isoform X6 n=1 Tax=Drosophila albomicans TaxID=7291 RepID=A0A6P8XKX6_DROAB|nr:uncharacterized protein LOC117574014 isoform X6 [Drosophila albomicans]XP_060664953.1 uncharacterized protein LOC132797295 isoform X5 [Drosophila nasuta]XP_062138933.1 uncharacterized protein LOC133847748 isoform X6 [Drosophila sulfurigaster albostrigata]
MRKLSTHQIAALVFCSAVCLINASPLPQPAGNQELDMLQIPLANGKEIDVLTIGTKDQEQLIADRNKRTIGLLRELFPDITKEINEQINRLANNILQRVGPVVLGTVLNPQLERTSPRKPSTQDDDNDNDVALPINMDYEMLPEELTKFEPDKDFDSMA